MAAVAQDDPPLLFIEFNIRVARYRLTADRVAVEEAFHRLAVPKVGAHNIGRILGLDMGIEDAVGFNNDIGALLTEAVAAAEVNLDTLDALLDQLAF